MSAGRHSSVLTERPKVLTVLDHSLKRWADIALSIIGLVVLAPLLAALAVLVLLDSPGPVFYRGVRVGWFGRPFRMFKFRSMVVGADRKGGPSTMDNDPRITYVGKLMRRYKLDELPQLINILKGEMSLVGPRPEVQMYVDMYTDEERAILDVRPGITDWASIANPDEGAVLAGSEDPEAAYMERIWPGKMQLRLEYARNRSLWVDLKILLLTVAALTQRGGEEKTSQS